MIAVVNAEMLAALRVVSVERGLDPRDFALVAFGGAGALHACALAEELEIGTVLVPEAAGVLSALGLALSDERRDTVRSLVVPLEGADLPAEGEADVRYAGQSFELTVPLGGDVAEAFHRAHEDRYGYADRSPAARAGRAADGDCRAPAPSTRTHPCRLVPTATGLVELDGSTAWIPPGWRGDWRDGSLVVTRA